MTRVRDELPPPVITIRDPNAPSPLSDVIGGGDEGDDRPRRQWSWRDRGLAVMVVAVIVTTGAGLWGVEHLHDEQRLDKASVTEIDLNAANTDDSSSDFSFGTIQVALANDGPHAVSVLTARMVGTSLPVLTARSNSIKPNGTKTVRFRRPRCPESLPAFRGTGFSAADLELTVRTYRGQTTKVTVTDPSAVNNLLSGYYFVTVEACRLYPPESSLQQVSRLTTVRQGKDLVVTLAVRNRSKKPRTLHRILAGGGLSVVRGTEDLEFAGGARHDITLTLRATECARAVKDWGLSFDELSNDPSSSFEDLQPGDVSMVVYGDGELDARGILFTSGFDGTGITPWVRSVCPTTK